MLMPVKAAITSANNSYPTKWPINGSAKFGLIT